MSARGRAESSTAAALDGDASMTDVSSSGEIYRSIDEEGLAASCQRLAGDAEDSPAQVSNGQTQRPMPAASGDNERQVSGGGAEVAADPGAGAMTPRQLFQTSLLSSLEFPSTFFSAPV